MAILTLLLWRHLIKTGNNMVSIRFLSICNKALITYIYTYVCVYIYIVSRLYSTYDLHFFSLISLQ